MLALLLAVMLQAAGNPDQPPDQTMMVEPAAMLIATFDANGDGRVTRAEMDAGLARTFASADTDHKGSIGYIQYGQWALTWLGDANALPSAFEVDGDHDDRITLAELQATFDGIFARLDSDHDGVLTHAELLTIRSAPLNDPDAHRRHRR
jgi:hypothetical protein